MSAVELVEIGAVVVGCGVFYGGLGSFHYLGTLRQHCRELRRRTTSVRGRKTR